MASRDNDPFGLDEFNIDNMESDNGFNDSNNFDDSQFDNMDDIESGDNVETDSQGSNSDNNSTENLNISLDDIDDGYPEQPKDNGDKKKNLIKTSLIVAAGGLVIILIAFVVNRGAKKDTIDTYSNTDNIEIEEDTPIATDVPISPNDVHGSSNNSWVEFDGSLDVSNSTEIESSFTVTDINYYAMVANDKSDKQVRSVVTGNISGLVGTYELDIDFDVAQKLTIGAVFKITYKLANNNSYKVISSINY